MCSFFSPTMIGFRRSPLAQTTRHFSWAQSTCPPCKLLGGPARFFQKIVQRNCSNTAESISRKQEWLVIKTVFNSLSKLILLVFERPMRLTSADTRSPSPCEPVLRSNPNSELADRLQVAKSEVSEPLRYLVLLAKPNAFPLSLHSVAGQDVSSAHPFRGSWPLTCSST